MFKFKCLSKKMYRYIQLYIIYVYNNYYSYLSGNMYPQHVKYLNVNNKLYNTQTNLYIAIKYMNRHDILFYLLNYNVTIQIIHLHLLYVHV